MKINITDKELKNILNKCLICQKKDKVMFKTHGFVKTNNVGEKVGIDMLEITSNERIIVLIDYFSRFVFAKLVNSKHMGKIIKFIDDVYKSLKFQKIVADNGKEFNNKVLKRWAKEKCVKIEYSIPYYHESNGRVERANRTIRNALKKTKGPIKVKLAKVINSYNNTIHRGISITPYQGLNSENKMKILEHQRNYSKEFGIANKTENFKINQKVWIRNEKKINKMDNEFSKVGTVKEILGNGIYKILLQNNKDITRHKSQLKSFEDLKEIKDGNVEIKEV